jgi:hypothetical protein
MAAMRIRGDGDRAGAGESHTAFVARLYESPIVSERKGLGMVVQVITPLTGGDRINV